VQYLLTSINVFLANNRVHQATVVKVWYLQSIQEIISTNSRRTLRLREKL
jgi:hypothetical protein